jgi:hypothetical protein
LPAPFNRLSQLTDKNIQGCPLASTAGALTKSVSQSPTCWSLPGDAGCHKDARRSGPDPFKCGTSDYIDECDFTSTARGSARSPSRIPAGAMSLVGGARGAWSASGRHSQGSGAAIEAGMAIELLPRSIEARLGSAARDRARSRDRSAPAARLEDPRQAREDATACDAAEDRDGAPPQPA